MENKHCCHNENKKEKIHLGKKLKITSIGFISLFLISFMPIFDSFNKSLISYLEIVWWAVLLGLLIGGFIDYFVPKEFIYKHLGKNGPSSIFKAVIGGFLMSACSHGILAISMQLYKKGAGVPAVITFLLASPWANFPLTILMFGFWGVKALFIIGAAMFIAIITGFVFLLLDKFNLIEKQKEMLLNGKVEWVNVKNFDMKKSVFGVTKGAVSLANMTLWWILIGITFSAIIGAYVPSHIFTQYFGPTLVGLLITLGVATIIEVCSEGSAPIAFELYKQVGTLGNPFVFLMAGVVTDYTEIGLIWTNIGKKAAIWLPIVTVPQVVLIGYLFNILL